MKTMLVIFTLLFASTAFTPSSLESHTTEVTPRALSQKPPRWEKLGQRRVDYTRDRDEILVTAREGFFTALKIRVKRAPIQMHRMVIHFADGSTREVELREHIRAGGSSRVIDLPGNKRIIRKVVFVYDTRNSAPRKAVVELWGRH